MAPLTLSAAAIATMVVTPAQTQAVAAWRPYITEASRRFGIPEAWIERVIRAESAGWAMLGGRPIRSRVGAIGLMQLMPGTYAAMRQTLDLGDDPDDPHDNLLAGTFYLRLMYGRFGYPGLFAAYNAGPGRYSAHLATGQPLPRETVAYLAKLSGPSPFVRAAGPQRPDSLFMVRREQTVDNGLDTRMASLFAVRNDVP